jgi:diacylglycerol kinase family enzyme
MDERRIRVLWNPTSGRKGGIPTNRGSRRMLLELMPRYGLGDELIEPGSESEAIEAATDAVQRGYDVVVAAGGDGTIGLVGRQLIGTRTALGILPLGSVMNIPRMLGLPRDPDEAARIIAEGHVRSIDVGQVGDRIFYEAGSVGMHAAATRELPLVDRGDYGAIVRSIAAAFRYRPSEMVIELDGDRRIVVKAVVVAVANGPFMGPGLPVAPEPCSTMACSTCACSCTTRRPSCSVTLRPSFAVAAHRSDARSRSERAGSVSRADDRSRRVPMPWTSDRPPVVFEIRPGVLTVVAPDPAASPRGSGRHGPHFPAPGRGGAATA